MKRIQLIGASFVCFALTACFEMNLGGKIRPGASCSNSSDCGSGNCLGQLCCSTASCGSDPTCRASTCDSTGACVYPTGACGVATCNATTHQITTNSCSQGTCTAAAPVDCPVGSYCTNGACQAQGTAGTPCTSNDSCASGICGLSGTGNCCSSACLTSDAHGCGASGCDTTGACIYPTATCVVQFCTGHALTQPASCDGHGACAIPSPATVDCAPYQCAGSSSCRTDCASSGDCSIGFCHTATPPDALGGHVCCPPYPGNQIEVDGTQGKDIGCCGGGAGASACATIAYAVGLVRDAALPGTTVNVTNPPNGVDWTVDTFPIQLSYGLILNAPGVAFSNTRPDSWSFLIQSFGAETDLSAVIEGNAAKPISIGTDSQGNVSPATGIYVSPPMTLFLLNASVHDQFSDAGTCSWEWNLAPQTPCNSGIWVRPGATLTLGTDGQGASGTVTIGDAYAGAREMTGILCEGLPPPDGGVAQVATVNDTGSTATPSVWIQNQLFGLVAFDGCKVSLTSSPQFGAALNGQGTCDPTLHAIAPRSEVYLISSDNIPDRPYGSATNDVTISNATLECSGAAFEFDAYGTNKVTGDSDLIQYNDYGVYFGFAGSIKMSNSTVSHNSKGIFSSWSDGILSSNVDLGAGGNQITCNDTADTTPGWGGDDFGEPAAGVVLAYPTAVAVSNVSWNHWDADAGHTQIWACQKPAMGTNQWFSDCSCSGSSDCPALPPDGGPLAAPSSGVDIVYQIGTSQTIDDAHGTAAANGCP